MSSIMAKLIAEQGKHKKLSPSARWEFVAIAE
jgi:hypothetical protein